MRAYKFLPLGSFLLLVSCMSPSEKTGSAPGSGLDRAPASETMTAPFDRGLPGGNRIRGSGAANAGASGQAATPGGAGARTFCSVMRRNPQNKNVYDVPTGAPFEAFETGKAEQTILIQLNGTRTLNFNLQSVRAEQNRSAYITINHANAGSIGLAIGTIDFGNKQNPSPIHAMSVFEQGTTSVLVDDIQGIQVGCRPM